MLLGSGLVTAEELTTGRSTQSVPTFLKPMSAADVTTARNVTERYDRPYAGEPRFAAGDRVRAVLRVRPGHTRLPRYVRGHVGIVVAVHGAHVVPDENAQGRSIAEPLYTVGFALAELFFERGDSADKIHLDLWERYLERIEPT